MEEVPEIEAISRLLQQLAARAATGETGAAFRARLREMNLTAGHRDIANALFDNAAASSTALDTSMTVDEITAATRIPRRVVVERLNDLHANGVLNYVRGGGAGNHSVAALRLIPEAVIDEVAVLRTTVRST